MQKQLIENLQSHTNYLVDIKTETVVDKVNKVKKVDEIDEIDEIDKIDEIDELDK